MKAKLSAIAFALFAVSGAQAADYHNVGLEVCQDTVAEQLNIDPANYEQRISRIRGNQRALELRLKVTDEATADEYKVTCKVNTVDRSIARLDIRGQTEGAREAVASLGQD